MNFSSLSIRLLKVFLVVLFFVSPLIFFTNFTRNPYFFQITLVNISIALWMIIFLYESIRRGEVKIRLGPFHYISLFLILVFLISSVYAYFSHSDFFKPAIINENRRIWFFTIVNAFLPFFIFSQKDCEMLRTNRGFPYSISFILTWGFAWLLFKLFKTSQPFFDLYGFILWIWAVVYLYRKSELNFYHLMHLAMLSGFYASVYGVLQYFGIEIIWDKTLMPYGRRAVTTFGNPNFASSYVVMLVPFALFYYSKVKEKIRGLYFIFLLFFVMMIFASLTRSSLIALICEILVLGYFSFKNSIIPKTDFKKVLLLILLIAVIWPDQDLNFFKSGVLKRFYEAFEKTSVNPTLYAKEKEIYQSFHQRLLIWRSGIEMFLENPILGKGWGNFELFYPFYQGYYLRINPAFRSLRTHANNAHNEIVEIVSQTGICGLGVFILFIVSFIVHILRNYKFSNDETLIIIFVSVAAMFIDNILNVSIHFAVPGLLFFSILGASGFKISKEKIIKLNLFLRFISVLLIILFSLYIYQWMRYLGREIYYFYGFKEMRRGNYSLAKNYLEKAVAYHRWEVNTIYELANSYVKNTDFNKAVVAYKDALKSNAGYDEIYFNLAVVEKNLLNLESAKKNLLLSIWINPFNEKAYYAYGEIALKQGSQSVDEAVFSDAVKNHPYDGYIHWLFGYFKEIKGDLNLAKDYYSLALLNDPTNMHYINSLRRFLSPDDSILRFADLYKKVVVEERYDKEIVEKDIKELESLYSSSIRFKFLKAKYLYDMANYEKSLLLLKEIIEENSSFYPAFRAIGLIYERMNNYKMAVDYYTRYLVFDPTNKGIKERIESLKRMK